MRQRSRIVLAALVVLVAVLTTSFTGKRVDIDWESGKFRSVVMRYPWGEPKVEVSQAVFAGRWAWDVVQIEATEEGYSAVVTASIKLSNFALEP